MSSKIKKLLISILLGLIVFICGATLWSLFQWYRLPKTPQSYDSDKLASAKGWKISQSNGNAKVYDGSIESFSIERAKLGPFAIGPLYVAHLNKVIFDFYAEGLLPDQGMDENPPQRRTFGIDALAGPLSDIRKNPIFRSRKIGIFNIAKITLNLWKEKKRILQISSDRATIDRETGDVLFVGHASLDAAENGSILSYRIRWVKKTSLFRIMDPFILTKGDRKEEGRGLETDYLLKKIRYPIKG